MRRRGKIAIGVTAALALGLAAVAPSLLALHERSTLRRVIETTLRDPTSATYSRDSVHRTEHGVYYCGLINAKNGFGGYTGYRRFVASGQDVMFQPHPGDFGDLDVEEMKAELRFLDFYRRNCRPDPQTPTE